MGAASVSGLRGQARCVREALGLDRGFKDGHQFSLDRSVIGLGPIAQGGGQIVRDILNR